MLSDLIPEPGEVPVREDIAIVGMSCIFAGSPDLDTYWRNIVSKVDSISDPVSGEWEPEIFYDPSSKSNDRVYCKRGGYIGDIASFRPMDFGIMPVTVDGGEPDQWLALRVAQEALTDAGYSDSPAEHERTEVILGKGTYVNRGNLTVGYHGMTIEYVLQVLKSLHPEYTEPELQEIKRELKTGLPPFNADTAPALIGNIIAGRIANRLDLMGSSFTVDAACASALLAIEIGVHNLLSRKCDLVLAGGANANAPLPTLSLFCQLGALSRQEQIRPFDKNADGTILGEGLGMVVLKRLSDARRDGNRVYACIRGVGIASDGRALHVMAPRIEGEELALKRAYEMAGFSPQTVGLIEAHGTATPVGDVVEVQALARVFGNRQGDMPSCAIGSVKSMIGHTMPAAGIAGVIKAALSLYHSVLPPTLNCTEPNPALNLEETPFYVNTETRPWINGAGTPRRAGVNSFGFGGINGHVVLEEAPETDSVPADAYLAIWDTEVFILEAPSRPELVARCEALLSYLDRSGDLSGDLSVKDLAYSLNTQLSGQSSRLSVVAASKDELRERLIHTLKKLADPQCHQIKDNKGIYYFEQRLEGKLAFIFPGEGAQYPNMLLDLCLHFPEVRKCFDLTDQSLMASSRKLVPSEFIFPRTILSESNQSLVQKSLWELEGAIAGVLVGNWALWTLLSRLEIRPDVIMGHSTGDYSAMVAAKVIDLAEEASFVEVISLFSDVHDKLAEKIDVPEVTLVAIAADRSVVQPIIDSIDGELYLAMDNCPHQNVVLGKKEAIERLLEQLRSHALMYEVLPFDRPYHTPLFQEYAEGAGEEFFARVPLSSPKIDLYSCTSASLYPSDEMQIRKLFVDHWAQPVLCSQTVEKMYEDGVRIFVEAGPRGNLTTFVSDILRGKPHLAMPSNVARRSGITQLNHLLGVLAAQGVSMQMDYLYSRRKPQTVPWEDSGAVVKQQRAPMPLSLAIPALRVAPRAPKPVPVVTPHPVASPHPVPTTQATVSPATSAMQEYVKGMEAFLRVEQNVMESFLHRARSAADSRPSKSAPAVPPVFPLLGQVTSLHPGQELVAVRRLTLEEDRFLLDHALGAPVSVTDPELRPLIVVPLTVSLEILAEAGAALLPGHVLIEIRNIQAHHWIRVDDTPVDLQISAKRVNGSPDEVLVEVRNGASIPAVRGTLVFAAAYPAAPAASPVSFTDDRKSTLAADQLYDGRSMFHGPAFQGVTSMDRSAENGAIGHIQTLPTTKLFRSTSAPHFVTDPVALDAAGQLVGFWAAERLEKGFVVFPFRVDSVRFYGARKLPGEKFTCRLKVEAVSTEHIRSHIDVVAVDGKVWMELVGWEDRRFDPPQRFHRAWTTPGEALISESCETYPDTAFSQTSGECRRVDKLFETSGGLWLELWASLVLSRRERKIFGERREPEKLQMEWLSGRTAAKEAVVEFLRKRHGLRLRAADIEIAEDGLGKLIPSGTWTSQIASVPQITLTQTNGSAIATASAVLATASLARAAALGKQNS